MEPCWVPFRLALMKKNKKEGSPEGGSLLFLCFKIIKKRGPPKGAPSAFIYIIYIIYLIRNILRVVANMECEL